MTNCTPNSDSSDMNANKRVTHKSNCIPEAITASYLLRIHPSFSL